MKAHALIAPVLGLLLAADDAKQAAIQAETARLQGQWKFVSMEVEGRKKPDTDFGKYTAVFQGNLFTVREKDKIAAQSSFTLDPSKRPRSIDLSATLEHKGRLIRGIYTLEDDRLTICDRGAERGQRPSEFATHPGTGLVLIVLERARP